MHGVFTLWYSRSVSGDTELLSLLQFASGHCSVRDSRSPLAALIFKCRICAQACGQRALASGRAFCLAPTFCSAQLSQNHHYCSLAKSFTCERERASAGIMEQQQDQYVIARIHKPRAYNVQVCNTRATHVEKSSSRSDG